MEEADRGAMQGITIAMLVVGGLVSIIYAFVRKDEREMPKLPIDLKSDAQKSETGKEAEAQSKATQPQQADAISDQAQPRTNNNQPQTATGNIQKA